MILKLQDAIINKELKLKENRIHRIPVQPKFRCIGRPCLRQRQRRTARPDKRILLKTPVPHRSANRVEKAGKRAGLQHKNRHRPRKALQQHLTIRPRQSRNPLPEHRGGKLLLHNNPLQRKRNNRRQNLQTEPINSTKKRSFAKNTPRKSKKPIFYQKHLDISSK